MPIRQPACICGELLVNHPGGIACGETATGPRVCVREGYQEIEAPPYLFRVWTFHYSDGTTEQLSQTGAL